MDEKTKQRIEEIQKRLENYRKRKSEFYYYDPKLDEEDGMIQEFLEHAADDVKFLLNEVRRLKALQALRHSPSQAAEKPEK